MTTFSIDFYHQTLNFVFSIRQEEVGWFSSSGNGFLRFQEKGTGNFPEKVIRVLVRNVGQRQETAGKGILYATANVELKAERFSGNADVGEEEFFSSA